jgi:hypothetical protein
MISWSSRWADKRAKGRGVPISAPLVSMIDACGEVVGRARRILRALGRNKQPGENTSSAAVYAVIDREDLQFYDLWRTFVQSRFEAGARITQQYLNLELDFETTASDFIPLNVSG